MLFILTPSLICQETWRNLHGLAQYFKQWPELSKNSIYCFSVVNVVQKGSTPKYPTPKYPKSQNTKNDFLSKFCYCSEIWHSIFELISASDILHLFFFIFSYRGRLEHNIHFFDDTFFELFSLDNVCYFLNNKLKRCFYMGGRNMCQSK